MPESFWKLPKERRTAHVNKMKQLGDSIQTLKNDKLRYLSRIYLIDGEAEKLAQQLQKLIDQVKDDNY
jgi:hypothetical protein